MPPVASEFAPPSGLEDVLVAVRDLLGDAVDSTPVYIGDGYKDDFLRTAPSILFVPEKRGSAGPPLELGNAASIKRGCDLYVRGVESGADASRFTAASLLMRRVISTLGRAATGRLTFREHEDDSPIKADAYGADLHLGFLYTHDVEHDAAIWAVPPPPPDTSPQRPLVPPGIAGTEPTTFTSTN